MYHPGAGAPAPEPSSQLPKASRVDRHDEIDVGCLDCVKLGGENTSAFFAAHQRVRSGRTATAASVREFDVVGNAREEAARLRRDTQAVAQMAGILERHPRATTVDPQLIEAIQDWMAGEVVREFAHPVQTQHPAQMRGAPA